MSKQYCAVNSKYYKDNHTGEIAHVLRLMKDNVNAIKELTKNNFGMSFNDNNLNLLQNYRLMKEMANDDLVDRGKKKLQHNANTFLDSVLIFDRDLFDDLIKEGKQDELKKAAENFMKEFGDEYGFEPVGFEFHLDEGKIDENGVVKHNYHAHAVFLNYDFNKGIQPLRSMRKKDWENSQDLMHKHFKQLGFDRGEKKALTGAEHKNKAEYVRELQLEVETLESKLKQGRAEVLGVKKEMLNILEDMGDGVVEAIETANKHDEINSKAQEIYLKLCENESIKSVAKQIKTKMPRLFDMLKGHHDTLKNLMDLKTPGEIKQELEIKERLENLQNKPEKAETELKQVITLDDVEIKDIFEDSEELINAQIEEKKTDIKKTMNKRKHGKRKKNR